MYLFICYYVVVFVFLVCVCVCMYVCVCVCVCMCVLTWSNRMSLFTTLEMSKMYGSLVLSFFLFVQTGLLGVTSVQCET